MTPMRYSSIESNIRPRNQNVMRTPVRVLSVLLAENESVSELALQPIAYCPLRNPERWQNTFSHMRLNSKMNSIRETSLLPEAGVLRTHDILQICDLHNPRHK